MARKDFTTAPTVPTRPQFETRSKVPLLGGLVPGIDNSMWLYRSVPMSTITDAKTVKEAIEGGRGLETAFEELSELATVGLNRNGSKSTYRQFQLLGLNVPTYFRAPETSAIKDYLNTSFRDTLILRRELVLGVKLIPSAMGSKKKGQNAISAAIDSLTHSLVYGGSLLSDFDKDVALVSGALSRAGLTVPSPQTLHWTDSWWNRGGAKAVPILPHDEHIHFFHSMEAKRQVEEHYSTESCNSWPEEGIPGEEAITFAALNDFTIGPTDVSEEIVRWASELMSSHARVVSVRGLIEPQAVTRKQLASQKRKWSSDIDEFHAKNKTPKAEQEERRQALAEMEGSYARGSAPSTLIDCSVVVGFDGVVEDLRRVTPRSLELGPMVNLQPAAWYETMLCSSVQANPLKQDLPATMVAYSGIQNISRVGDADGALMGFTEVGSQPVYISNKAASAGDSFPLFICAAGTGSGKLLDLAQEIPTPTGFTKMGDIRVGDQVLGRDGKPCTVSFISEVNENPDLYKVSLSDGQSFNADADHQWVVSTFTGRNKQRGKDHVAAIANQKLKWEFIARLRKLAIEHSHDEILTREELFRLVQDDPQCTWATSEGMMQVLSFMNLDPILLERKIQFPAQTVLKTDPARLYPAADVVNLAIQKWHEDNGRWAQQSQAKAEIARTIVDTLEPGVLLSPHQMGRKLQDGRLVGSANNLSAPLMRWASRAGIAHVMGGIPVTVPVPSHTRSAKPLHGYFASEALNTLAARLEFLAGEELTLDPAEQILTTAEMLSRGVSLPQGNANFAIRVAKPVELPAADLLVDPYTLGAWLGDGGSHHAEITSMDSEIIKNITDAGYTVQRTRVNNGNPNVLRYYFTDLKRDLNSLMGRVTKNKMNKRIPMAYLRASFDQRLAVLQGLMDTDGTIGTQGACELSLNKRDLSEDALQLIRSLGIKAALTMSESAYKTADGARKVTGTRHRIHFTTNLPVFRLARKLARVPVDLREAQQWIYVKSIEKIASAPGRCIQVDSPDSTYLIGDFVPNHNTQLLQWLSHQWGLMKIPQVIVDPKRDSDLGPAALASGGQIFSFDEFAQSDGALDPIRFSPDKTIGAALAADMISRIRPWSEYETQQHETAIAYALQHGVSRGARATGQALRIAEADGMIDPAIVAEVFKVADSYPMFRATFGVNPDSPSMAVSEGISLFKVGRTQFELPAAGSQFNPATATPLVRASVNLLRMIVRAAMVSLSGRAGVLHFDEAWVLQQAAPDELEQIGRLARSQNVLPIIYTQTPSGAVKAGMKNFTSRGAIGHILDEGEAVAGMQLFGAENEELVQRVTRKEYLSGGSGVDWGSLKPLWSVAENGERMLLRPSVFYHSDLKNQIAPVEIHIPPSFFALSSTNPDDIRRRDEKLAIRAKLQGI